VDGTARGVGEATLQSLTPVDLTGEGIARGVGEATLRAATLLIPAAGIARAVGEATLEASYNLTAEGPGGRSDLILTPGVWPGAKQRVTIPSFFDRMSNRRYGGALSAERPQWYAGIDESNPLAEYAAIWVWFANITGDVATDISGNERDVTIVPALGANEWTNDGLEIVTQGTYGRFDIPALDPNGKATFLIYWTRYGPALGGDNDTCMVAQPPGGWVWHQYHASQSYRINLTGAGGYFWSDELSCDYNIPSRLILSVENGVEAVMYVNGVEKGTFASPNISLGLLSVFCLWGGDTLNGVIHEFGILNGYAATAADVATNPMFAMPYGFRAAPTPVTDRV